MNRQLFFSTIVLLFLFIGTTVAILYGRGYRFGLDGGRPDLAGTGILVATSNPNGASVFINDHLTTATDNTINLPPGDYSVKITKDGYQAWKKQIKVQKEVVTKAEALLFPIAPKLESVTLVGADNPVLDPSFGRVAYKVSSQSAKKNGIYILDMSQRPILTLQSSSTQIVDDTTDTFSKAQVSWSPDGNNLLATINETTYELSATSFNSAPVDVTETLQNLKTLWGKDKLDKEKARLDSLKPSLSKMIAENMDVTSWSPDDTKLLYTASRSATLPLIITPRLLGTDSTVEQRSVKAGNIYVYDIAEDRNYGLSVDGTKLNSPKEVTSDFWNPILWLADSKHLLYTHDKRIDIMEFDGANSTTVYAGPFDGNYVFPWQSVSKILVLTNLDNPQISPNLYTIELK